MDKFENWYAINSVDMGDYKMTEPKDAPERIWAVINPHYKKIVNGVRLYFGNWWSSKDEMPLGNEYTLTSIADKREKELRKIIELHKNTIKILTQTVKMFKELEKEKNG